MTFDSVVVLDSNDVIKKAGESKLNFNTLFQVPAENVHQAIEMAQVFQDAINGDTLEFNFDQALQLVKEHKEMAVTGTINQSIVKQDNQVSAMVDDVMNLLDTVVGVYLDKETPTYEKFKNTIEQGFTNLNEQKESSWIFWSKESEHKTTYTYNILFAVANKDTGSVMAAAPIGLTITVDVDKEKVLWITTKDKHNYSVNVKSITVVEALQA
ncbi:MULTISPECIES: delta-endotoxin CytB [Vibrio]|uniref:Type-2Aa cytolytic delta-endotoxin n=2 Tax=Vibrio TaxID=662 RepID=A0A5P9CMZ3_9VIBR|nr:MULTISPECIES: delta-endotoxin CytB [Vibrio]MYM59572.1 delta-endotoxin CytB [Vibrio tetraodonis subsp. pristinus]QFT27097.1 Type-2Aa cytolytic delta-endotoxin [Vibrio aquimaris]